LIDVELDVQQRTAQSVLEVFTKLPGRSASAKKLLSFVLQPVGRVAASLRHGRWDDPHVLPQELSLDQIESTVRSFESQPIYDMNFFDAPDEHFGNWSAKVSLDEWLPPTGTSHTLLFFQNDITPARHLDVQIWFDCLEVFDESGDRLSVDEVAAGGEAWWAAFGKRTQQ
jgi:hypothetical protein